MSSTLFLQTCISPQILAMEACGHRWTLSILDLNSLYIHQLPRNWGFFSEIKLVKHLHWERDRQWDGDGRGDDHNSLGNELTPKTGRGKAIYRETGQREGERESVCKPAEVAVILIKPSSFALSCLLSLCVSAVSHLCALVVPPCSSPTCLSHPFLVTLDCECL